LNLSTGKLVATVGLVSILVTIRVVFVVEVASSVTIVVAAVVVGTVSVVITSVSVVVTSVVVASIVVTSVGMMVESVTMVVESVTMVVESVTMIVASLSMVVGLVSVVTSGSALTYLRAPRMLFPISRVGASSVAENSSLFAYMNTTRNTSTRSTRITTIVTKTLNKHPLLLSFTSYNIFSFV